jgi:hypothetical protein
MSMDSNHPNTWGMTRAAPWAVESRPCGAEDSVIEPVGFGEESHETFLQDLGQLLNERPGQWVAYHGAERIGFASTKAELYQQCFRRGLKRGEFLVRSIEPEPGEIVIGPRTPGNRTSGRDR